MDNIEIDIDIDPVAEMQHLKAMYMHYKTLYRQLFLLCCSKERKVVKAKRDACKQRLDKIIEERCKNV